MVEVDMSRDGRWGRDGTEGREEVMRRGGHSGETGTYELRDEERRRYRGYGRVRGMEKTWERWATWGRNGVIGVKWGHGVEMDNMGEMAEVREMGMGTLSKVGKVRGIGDMGGGG